MRRIPPPLFLLALLLLLTASAGYLCGRVVALEFPPRAFALTPRPDRRPSVPVVHLSVGKDGALTGTLSGSVRIFLGLAPVSPDAKGLFRVATVALRKSSRAPKPATAPAVAPPPGAAFVASKRGKKYYPVASPSGQNIAAKNRLYFPDAASAEKKGYVRGTGK